MNRLSPNGKGFTLSPQPINAEILETLKNKQVKWNLTSKGDKFVVKFEKASTEFETFSEAVNWLQEELRRHEV